MARHSSGMSPQDEQKVLGMLELVSRVAGYSSELAIALSVARDATARRLRRRHRIAAIGVMTVGAVGMVVLVGFAVVTGVELLSKPVETYLAASVAVALTGLLYGVNVDVRADQLPRRHHDAMLVRRIVEERGGIGSLGGVAIFASFEELEPIVRSYLAAHELDAADFEVIRSLVVEGSELTVDQLIATAKSLR